MNYDNQELGNLSITNSYNLNMSKINISTKLKLDNKFKKAYVYETYVRNKEDAINLANKIFSKLNANIDNSQTEKYDDCIIFKSEKGNYSLWVYYKGLTTCFTDFSQLEAKGEENLTYKEIQSLLNKFDINLPKDANFRDNGDGNYSISLNMIKSKDRYLNGELICTINKNGIISNFSNNIICCKPYKQYDILSLKEAYNEILKGNFKLINMLDKNSNIEITNASLIYQLDNKGFYQPVYDFTANIDENINNHIYISALINN